VQEKVSAQMVSFPLRRHFVKLTPPRFPRLVENEAFFLAMASDCGLRVPEHELVSDRLGRSALLVQRFDRMMSPAGMVRLEQEDSCQLLGRYPADKYRVRYLEVATALLAVTDFPTLDARQLVQVYAFSYLIGNGDLHAKNISVGGLADGEHRMTPNYDLLSTLAYVGNDRMALELEGKQDNLRRRHFLEFAGRVGVGPKAVARDLDRMCDVAPVWAAKVGVIGLDERRTRHLERELLRRRDHLAREQ
jgi:serine/threonine-protein kinase HipA